MSEASRPDATDLPLLADANQIDMICDAFEEALAGGQSPTIEEYFVGCDKHLRERVLTELVLVDREYCIRRGEAATREVYRARFPEYSAVIESLEFSTIDERRPGRRTRHPYPTGYTVGSKVAQFELLEEIGAGASGTVWKARDSRLHRTVALKMPRQHRLTAVERERFLREGQACAQLRHPSIVAVYETGLWGGNAFIVTEFIDGLDLRESLRQCRPSYRETVELVAQLAEALYHAHQQGIIHRDLKPANVLMDRDGRPHITDFGLAKWLANDTGMTVEGNILGTPAYMSPEQARGETSLIDARTDVYGLGALLYEMLTGQQIFQGDVVSIIHQVIHDLPPSPRRTGWSVPRDLEAICLKALEKDQKCRYASAQEMAVDLRRYMRGERILARQANPLKSSWRWICRHRAVTVALVLLIIAVAAMFGIASLQRQNYLLQGYRPVLIATQPSGARIALARIDERTGEPSLDSADIFRPTTLTPLTISLRPGEYFVEAAIATNKESDFAEVRRIVPPLRDTAQSGSSAATMSTTGSEYALPEIGIKPIRKLKSSMAEVTIDDQTRHTNPLLPKVLYVDLCQTTEVETQPSAELGIRVSNPVGDDRKPLTFQTATNRAEARGMRLPSAAEYDAIVEFVAQQARAQPAKGKTDFSFRFSEGMAEWTTTRYHFPGGGSSRALVRMDGMIVLKGFGKVNEGVELIRTVDGQLITTPETNCPLIGCRFVHSGAPRFVQP